ncbi:hypothetical protein [Kitasatospora sp. NPDC057015]|uniref:hypothetical protein n=1 Tax=Kitasatospora sp. NPDC057015 TaxID=3346001 RepID=UPI00363DDE93
MTVRTTGDEWRCDAVFDPPLSEADQEGFDFLMALEPLFTLYFDEGSTILVDVSTTDVRGRLTLAVHEPETTEPAGTRRVRP